jgi:hypothetical protein
LGPGVMKRGVVEALVTQPEYSKYLANRSARMPQNPNISALPSVFVAQKTYPEKIFASQVQ